MPVDRETREFESTLYALLSLAVFCVLLSCNLYYAGRGYDFTDEGLYLFWIADPWSYSASTSQFGFIYHPLYLLAGGDIANLRRAGTLISAALTVALMWIALRKASAGSGLSPWRGAAYALGLGAAYLTFYHLGLPTPSYNSLNLQAILVVLVGMVLLLDTRGRPTLVLASALIGLGGWLAFMAKPTTAPGLGVIAFVFILVAVRERLLALAVSIAVAVALLIVGMFAIDGSVGAYVQRYQEGMTYYRALFGGGVMQNLFARGAFVLGTWEQLVFAAASATTFALTFLLELTRERSRPFRIAAFAAVAIIAAAFVIFGMQSSGIVAAARMQPLWIVAPSAAALFCAYFFAQRPLPNGSWRLILLALLFLPAPFLFAFGTSNFVWEHAVLGGAPWVAAAVMVAARTVRAERIETVLAPLSLTTAAVASLLLAIGMREPYRLPAPLAEQHMPASIGPAESILLVDAAAGAYLSALRSAAANNGFAPDTPILDLTGGHPGTVFALGGMAPGQPWLIGGYSRSEDFVRLVLANIPCRVLAEAWLLDTPDGPRRIPPAVPASSGIYSASYAEIARLPSPDAQGLHVLLKPKLSTQTEQRCEASREAG